MRIACLQFGAQHGAVHDNMTRAEAVLSRAKPTDLDLLILPDLAFTGRDEIASSPEPQGAGYTGLWARMMALKYKCVVMAGYPEIHVTRAWPSTTEYFNSVIIINPKGETIANYRKSVLYPSPDVLDVPDPFYNDQLDGLGNVVLGPLNWVPDSLINEEFQRQFPSFILTKGAPLVVLSTAWAAESIPYHSLEPDEEALRSWLWRLEPLIRAEEKVGITVVIVNKTGQAYSGTSTVLQIKEGAVWVYGMLGRGETNLLVVDDNKKPKSLLQLDKTLIDIPRPESPKLRTVFTANNESPYIPPIEESPCITPIEESPCITPIEESEIDDQAQSLLWKRHSA